jgi:hypothetical protein
MTIDDTRHRDKGGEISRKHGNTLIRTLRMTYGSGFASGCAGDAKLSDVLAKLDETSLRHLILDHDVAICRDERLAVSFRLDSLSRCSLRTAHVARLITRTPE